MRQTFLLPCQCGREIPVEATQSGQQVACECGRTLEVPTLRKLNTLKRGRPSDKPRPQSSSWGARQAVLTIGLLVMLTGLGIAAYLTYKSVSYRKQTLPVIEELTPLQSWAIWQQEFLPGVKKTPPWEQAYQAWLTYYRRWMIVAAVIAGVGVVTMAVSFLIPKRGRVRRRKPDPRTPARRRAPPA